MQLLQMLKASLKPGRGAIATLVMVGVVASVLSFVPTHGASNTLAESCPNPPSTPTLNYWPVTYDDKNTPLCHDFPAIDAALDTSNPQFSQSASDWSNGLTMQNGQQGVALMYIHNGASNNLDPAITTARNVRITTQTDTSVGSSHQIRVTMAGDNTNTVNSSFTIHTPANSQLEVIPNSGFMYDYQGRVILDQQNLNLGNSTFNLGDLDACFEYSIFLSFKFKVKTQSQENTNLTIKKGVRKADGNTGRGGASYGSSVTVDRGEQVEYRVQVTNTGNTTARNVTVTDNGVSGININSNSITVGVADDTILHSNQWSGNFPGTINLGDIPAGDSRIIKYTANVTTDRCDEFTNTARAQGSGLAQVSASALVKTTNCGGGHVDRDLEIKKQVRNLSGSSSFTETVDARTGEKVRFKIVVTNNGNATVNNVRMADPVPSGLWFDDNVDVHGGRGVASFSGRTLTVDIGTLREDESRTIEFTAEVREDDRTTICNEAEATGTGVSRVEDDACVKVTVTSKPGNPNIVLSKRAWNDTKNVDATSVSASRGDYITYSLVTTNNGSGDAVRYIISDDLSQVLPLAEMIDANGGTVSGNTITYPAITIKPGETIVKTFKVRVKTSLSKNLSYQLRNTYGNTIIINIPGDKVFVPPTTGSAGASAATFAGLLTAGVVLVRNRGSILKLILN
jgi:uncharacterized repeat protein (TIGR01451 family)